MDSYAVSFTVPNLTAKILPDPSPLSHVTPLPDATGSAPRALPDNQIDETELITSTTRCSGKRGCLVSATREAVRSEVGLLQRWSDDRHVPSLGINYHMTGSHNNVMSARGDILRSASRPARSSFRIPTNGILDYPLTDVSSVKPEVAKRIRAIAIRSETTIAIVKQSSPGSPGHKVLYQVDGLLLVQQRKAQTSQNSSPIDEQGNTGAITSGATGSDSKDKDKVPGLEDGPASEDIAPPARSYGLVTDKTCEVVITGPAENVDLAKLAMLVLQDEISGLQSEICEVNHKLQTIVGGRQRLEIQRIEAETKTNIYFPIPLLGVFDEPRSEKPSSGYRHLAIRQAPPASPAQSYRQPPLPHSLHPSNFYNSQNHLQLMPHMTGGTTGTHVSQMTPTTGSPNGALALYQRHQQVQAPFGHHQANLANYHQVQFSQQHQPQYASLNTPHWSPDHQQLQLPHHIQQPQYPHQYHDHNHNHHQPQYSQYPQYPQQHHYQQHAQQPQWHQHNQTWAPPHIGNDQETGQHPNNHALYFGNGYNQPQQAIEMSHTGISSMHSYAPSRMNSPLPPPPPSTMNSPMPPHLAIAGYNGLTPAPSPYSGQNHLHVGQPGPVTQYVRPTPPQVATRRLQISTMGINLFAGRHPGLDVDGGEQGRLGKSDEVHITGDAYGVGLAKELLLKLAESRADEVVSRDVNISPRKLDWLLMEHIETLRTIMYDNGTYIQVPCVGTQGCLITVFGDSRTGIERSIRSIMALACQFIVGSIWLLPVAFDVLLPQTELSATQMQPILKKVSHATGAEIVFKNNCFEMHGTYNQVREACMMIAAQDEVKSFQHEIKFQVELAEEHREFAAGKKNGKLNRIDRACGVRVKFETFNDYNFIINISGPHIGAVAGLDMLISELPAETSFFIPPHYHKKIIGFKGESIRRIIAAHESFVKFANNEEHAAIGGYHENEDNVMTRTPAKNQSQLELLKADLQNSINPKDRDYTREMVSIPRRFHRTLVGDRSVFFHDIGRKTSSTIKFPPRESASDLVTIFGPDRQIHIAAAMLLDHVPFEADLHVSPTADMIALVNSHDFVVFADEVNRDHVVTITPSAKFALDDEAIFKFCCQRSNTHALAVARDLLEAWFAKHDIQVYPPNESRRVDNVPDAFSHFNSKVLSGGHKAVKSEDNSLARARAGASVSVDSSDVKALFEGPSGRSLTHNNAGPGFAGPLAFPSGGRQPEYRLNGGEPSNPIRPATSYKHPSPHSHRGVSARTQSLDISSMNFSRSVAGSNALGPMPPSPIGGGVVASPSTASGPFFPTTSRPLHPHSTGGGRFAVDSITQGINNVQIHHP